MARKYLGISACVLPSVIMFKNCVCWVHMVNGESMTPILNPQAPWYNRWGPQDIVLGFKCVQPRKGDIVVARDPYLNRRIVKRIVALEDEDVVQVLRTGSGHEELLVSRVPRGHCWIEGDNHRESVDSRNFGAIPLGLVESVVSMVLWPFWRIKVLDDESYD